MPEALAKEITDYSAFFGTAPEMLLVPLLPMTNARTKVIINPKWSEPAILWGLVAAEKGGKKSAIVSLLYHALSRVDESIRSTQEESRVTATRPSLSHGHQYTWRTVSSLSHAYLWICNSTMDPR